MLMYSSFRFKPKWIELTVYDMKPNQKVELSATKIFNNYKI